MPEPNARLLRLLACACLAFAITSAVVVAQTAPIDCNESKACAELALEARERRAYETFHDLAWRAVQTGRPNDPDLMYLLARAQALSGRRRDALIMLRRLAESGVANDAATNDDLRSVRELPEWANIAELSARAKPVAAERVSPAAVARPEKPTAPPAPPPAGVDRPSASVTKPAAPAVVDKPRASAAKPAAPPVFAPLKSVAAAAPSPVVRNAPRLERLAVEETARFSTRTFVPGGFAYDAVSQRLLFGDVTGRRLFVVGEGSDRTVDLVRADSAGFEEVTAIAVDPKTGDLWVASSGAGEGGGAVHRLQLISGRSLTRIPVPGQDLMRLRDMAVTGDGTLLILDGATPRVFTKRPGTSTITPLMPLTVSNPLSITVSDDGRDAYVAHGEGITHIDVSSRRARALGAAKDVTLTGFEFLRWHRGELVGSQVQPDGTRGLVRLRLNRDHTAVSQATLIDDPASSEGAAAFATISDDDLYYAVARDSANQTAGTPLMDVRVRRIKLR